MSVVNLLLWMQPQRDCGFDEHIIVPDGVSLQIDSSGSASNDRESCVLIDGTASGSPRRMWFDEMRGVTFFVDVFALRSDLPSECPASMFESMNLGMFEP